MVLLFILLTIVVFLTILLFTVTSKIYFSFDSTNSELHFTLLWMYPLLRSEIRNENNVFVMTVYLFNKRILTKSIEQKQKVSINRNTLKKLNPTDIHVNTQYGFRDPFVTGLTCSAINVASQFFKVALLDQRPDFLTANDYISLDASAKLNLGNSLMKLI